MASMCRVLFVSILVASAVSTARAEAHEMPAMDDMANMGEEFHEGDGGDGKDDGVHHVSRD